MFSDFCRNFSFFTQVTYLPTYTPNDVELDDPVLFGENVRRVVAKYTKILITGHVIDDAQLFMEANNLFFLTKGSEINDLRNLSIDDIHFLLSRFKEFDKSDIGIIDIDQFSNILGYKSPTTESSLLYSILSHNKSEFNYKELLIWTLMYNTKIDYKDAMNETFNILEKQTKVHKTDFVSSLKSAFPIISRKEIERLFDDINVKKDGIITYDDFQNLFKNEQELIIKARTTPHITTL